jgi:hypothetical protein
MTDGRQSKPGFSTSLTDVTLILERLPLMAPV